MRLSALFGFHVISLRSGELMTYAGKGLFQKPNPAVPCNIFFVISVLDAVAAHYVRIVPGRSYAAEVAINIFCGRHGIVVYLGVMWCLGNLS